MSDTMTIADTIAIPETEKLRLNTLWAYNILDIVKEEEFDAITRLAARICDVPVSLINLIDSNRQWTKSCFGIEADELPRDKSICAYTILEGDSLQVQDLREDERFNEEYRDQDDIDLKFYAGVPLKSPKGFNIGALCVLDHQTNLLHKWQLECLKILAEEVIARLELKLKQRQLEELNKQKDEILHIVSHDMRNPLTGIIGISKLLQSDGAEDDEELNYLMGLIEDSATHLLKNVNELLDVAYIESSSFHLNPAEIDLEKATIDTIDLHRPTAKTKGVNLSTNISFESSSAFYDEVRFEQVLGNLLTNAIKFTPENGEVTVHVAYPVLSDNGNTKGLKLSVQDTGIGIPSEFISILFTKYGKHSRSGTSGEKSTGLGMPFLKSIIDAHGGKIDVDSKEGKGTTFTVFLPEQKEK